jgi:hypothetical protein
MLTMVPFFEFIFLAVASVSFHEWAMMTKLSKQLQVILQRDF